MEPARLHWVYADHPILLPSHATKSSSQGFEVFNWGDPISKVMI